MKNNPVTQTNVMTLLKGKSVYTAGGKSNEKQMHMERILSAVMCVVSLWARVSLARGDGVYIAMQRKILAVEKCICYQEKRSFKGESIQMKKQILEVSGELRMPKLQVMNFFFFFGRPEQMTPIPFCIHKRELQLCQV